MGSDATIEGIIVVPLLECWQVSNSHDADYSTGLQGVIVGVGSPRSSIFWVQQLWRIKDVLWHKLVLLSRKILFVRPFNCQTYPRFCLPIRCVNLECWSGDCCVIEVTVSGEVSVRIWEQT